MTTLAGCLIALVAFPLVTIPSIIYGITPYFLFPIGFILSLFTKQPSIIKALIIATRITLPFLLFVVPLILYFLTWEPLGWIFFGWIALYLIIQIYSGASKKTDALLKSWELASENEFYQNYLYIRERKFLIYLGIMTSLLLPFFIFLLEFDPLPSLIISLIAALITIRLSRL